MATDGKGAFLRWAGCCLQRNILCRLLCGLFMFSILVVPFSIDIRSGRQEGGQEVSQASDSASSWAFNVLKWSVILGPDISYAGWVNDWIAQKTESGPAYFEGQKRGYFTGGSYSARFNMTNDSLVTIQKPFIKSGCGGIDLFMGGFSFLNPEYLVKKLQNIMTAAPAVAFSVALNTISPEINQELSKFSSMIDELNKLQLNDCQAGKAIGTYAADEMMGKGDEANAALSNWAQNSGASTLYTDVKGLFSSNGGNPNGSGAQQMPNYLSGCSSDIQNLFGTSGFMLDKITKNGYYSYLQSYVPVIRAYIGDVSIHVDPTGNNPIPTIVYYPPNCGQAFDVESFVSGGQYVMTTDTGVDPPSATCAAASASGDTNANVTQYVNTELQTIMNNMAHRQAHGSTELTFIKTIPVPVYAALVTAQSVDPSSSGALSQPLTDMIAKLYGFRILRDLLQVTYNIAAKSQYVAHANQSGPSGNANTSSKTCQLSLLADLPSALKQMTTESNKAERTMQESVKIAMAMQTGIIDTAKYLSNFNAQANKMLSTMFGSRGAAMHALSQ